MQSLENASNMLKVASLDELVSFQRNQIKTPGENYLGLSHVQSGTGELTDSTDTVKGTCFTYTVGDILFARLRPYLNKVYLAEMDGCCSTEFHVLRVKDSKIVSADYLAAVLRAQIVLAQTVHMMTGNTHPRLTNDDVANLRIPIPKMETQETVVAEVLRRREESHRLLSEAVALLAGIDDFVLDTLGINPNVQQRSVFAISTVDILNSRFDSDFHSLRFRSIRTGIERGRYPSKTVGELCEYIRSGFAAGQQNQAFDYEDGIPHLRPLNLDIFGQVSLEGTKFVPKSSTDESKRCVQGEVLFNNTNSTELVGKSAMFELDQPCACSNHVTRLKPIDGVVPEYLASVFNALRRTGYLGLLSTNFNNQAGINTDTLSQLRIPKPPIEEQRAIATEVSNRREESRRLRAEAESGWEEAKRWFERQLLG